MTAIYVEGFICPECGNLIQHTDDPNIDHHSDCPTVTNLWIVHYGYEVVCSLCTVLQLEGDTYRMIPMLRDDLTDEDWESILGNATAIMEDKPVCYNCTTLRLVPGGKQHQTPTMV